MEAIRPEPTPLLSLLFSVAIITINFSPSKSCLLSLIICSSFPYTVACAKLDSLYHLLVVSFLFSTVCNRAHVFNYTFMEKKILIQVNLKPILND